MGKKPSMIHPEITAHHTWIYARIVFMLG